MAPMTDNSRGAGAATETH